MMRSIICIAALVVSVCGFASDALAGIQLNSLRSAHLQRSVGELQPLNRRDVDSIKNDLQQHFDTVLTLLDGNASASLEVALTRLERQQGVKWSPQQRNYWKAFLGRNRAQNIQRLVAYRNRGLFPQNEGYSLKAVPIFVDRHDTACAVGHLMRESGWEREVEMIEATNLYVYVPDVKAGALISWVLQSGLTQEEAALIQPSYPFYVDQNLTAIAQANSSVLSEGLIYSEFTTSATEQLGAKFGKGYYNPRPLIGLPNIEPVGTHWMIVGGELPFIDVDTDTDGHISRDHGESSVLSFRLNSSNSKAKFNQISIQTNYFESGFGVIPVGATHSEPLDELDPRFQFYSENFGITAKVTNLITMQQHILLYNASTIDELSDWGGAGNGVATLNFPEASDLLVEITAVYKDLTGDTFFTLDPFAVYRDLGKLVLGSYIVDFNVIPEPKSFAVLSLGLICLVGYGSRRANI